MDEIDYEIFGKDTQYVAVELDPGEAAVGEAGTMFYMEDGITCETIFGDSSEASRNSGIMGKLWGAGTRLLTGESLFTTLYQNTANIKRKVAFAAPFPGNIIPIDLKKMGGTFICQKSSFLCAAKGVAIGINFQKKLGVGFFGGEGFIMQTLQGDGMAFAHAGGTIAEFELKPGELMKVDTGCVVGYEPSIQFDVKYVGSLKTGFFGGEGLFIAELRGPGKIWLQSLPFSRVADRVIRHSSIGGNKQGEGSVLGNFGSIFENR